MCVFILAEQQFFNLEKKLAESQEQFLSQSKEYNCIKEENARLSKCIVLFCLHVIILQVVITQTLCFLSKLRNLRS